MGCCVALAYLVAVVRRGWFAVVPGARAAQAAAAFAPPARRPAPGGVAVAAGPPVVAARTAPARRPAARALVVVGLAWFGLGLVGMHAFGWFGWAEASLLSDTAFHSSGLWLAAAGGTMLAVRA
ncbi:hypothetical protein DJ010_17560 [Nocardioides silvaticus]|uniref:Uncharacterized protein n=1 Tax=Nocardioides silvaticus TaxID=2201891 RepID=A0A316TAT6_9ACTN|nr:hypothetical protein [Nocardioides silvaticus]PWN01377.1 hypothetical protein DJ010_17560 [Nocardioides silvaticus]